MNTASVNHNNKLHPARPKINLFYILNEWVYPLALGAGAACVFTYIVLSGITRVA